MRGKAALRVGQQQGRSTKEPQPLMRDARATGVCMPYRVRGSLGQRLSWLFGLLSAGILCGINNARQMLCGAIRVMTPETCVLVLDGARTKWNTEKHTNEMEHNLARAHGGTDHLSRCLRTRNAALFEVRELPWKAACASSRFLRCCEGERLSAVIGGPKQHNLLLLTSSLN
jgi:hypothetical protein